MTWRLEVTISDDQGNSITQATNFDPRMFAVGKGHGKEVTQHDRQRIFFMRVNNLILKLLYNLMPETKPIEKKTG